MKKKLEAELISIAHRILKLKNKSDLVQLHQETQKLYEKLSVLRFVEENFSDVKPTIGYAEIEDQLAVIFDTEIPSDEPVTEPVKTKKKAEPEVKMEEPVAQEAKMDEAQEETPEAPTQQTEPEVAQEKVPEPLEAEPQETASEVQNSGSAGAFSVSEQIEKSGKAIADLIKGIRGDSAKTETQKPDEMVSETEAEPIAELEIPEEEVAAVEAEATQEVTEETTTEKTPEASQTEDPQAAETKQEDLFKPAFEWSFDAKSDEPKEEAKITPAQIAFDDLLGQSYKDPIFVKPEDLQHEKETLQPAAEKSDVIPISRSFTDTSNVISINKSESLNERISKGITIGLNDRIAFMNHLFNNSSEDYNRVLSQLITIDTLAEAKNFIDTMVKPDYNNWEGKEDYEQRFMEIIEKKFS